MKEPNPEQTASILSFVTYHFLDGTIWRGYRMPHLSFEHLPPLADYDKATNLTSRSFPVSSRSLFNDLRSCLVAGRVASGSIFEA